MKKEPAFPIPDPDMTIPGQDIQETQGMSKRFYAACAAMQGILSYHGRYWQSAYPEHSHLDGLLPEEVAKLAIQFADELIKQEEKL